MDERSTLLERIDKLERAVSERDASIAKHIENEARLLQNVEALKRIIWGGSEKRPSDKSVSTPDQLLLAGILEGALRGTYEGGGKGTGVIEVPAHTRRKKGRRSQFPDHLPVLRTTFELDEAQRSCDCGGHLEPMGEETSKELERVEFSLVHEIVRVKYCCRACQEKVVTAPGPARVIDRGILGVGFLAHLLTERFLNHMPYHRQEKKYASEGLALSRSVLCTSARRCAELLEPITEELRRQILGEAIVQTDDSPVTIQKDSTGVKRQGRVWIYRAMDGRCWFDFTESRSRDGPAKVLKDFKGYLQADAYPGYDAFFHEGGATEVACWAHARRYYVTAESSDPDLAAEALRRIGELYGVEKLAKEKKLDDEARQALRVLESRPRLASLREWLATTRTQVLVKGPMGKAIDYTFSNWDALARYTRDGRLAPDNNGAERALRGVAVGRKNWIFVGNEGGGRTAANLYSLIETCKAAGVNPREYLRDVLLRISTCSDVTKLTPHAWKEHFLPEVEKRRHDALQKLLASISR